MQEEKDKNFQSQLTHLLFYRQYNTYQALLELHPKTDMSSDDCFAKAILYVMNWFKGRIGEETIKEFEELGFLEKEYPTADEYKDFEIGNTTDIDGLAFLDVKTAYLEDKQGWVFRLVEPDNGKEEKNIQGRVFTTKISVYKKEKSVILGIKESCKEPQDVEEDAAGFRPGFVRTIFKDPELLITEAGLKPEYAFSEKPIHVNGKSNAECDKIYNELINSPDRQMPILFVPGSFYDDEDGAEQVDRKTESFLGYCHVVVWDKSHIKLFKMTMEDDELSDVAGEGQIIFYRRTPALDGLYLSEYFDSDEEGILEEIKTVGQKEPLRKQCDFKKYYFSAPWWRTEKEFNIFEKPEVDVSQIDEVKELRAEIADIKNTLGDVQRDNDSLQRNIDILEKENKSLDKDMHQANADAIRVGRELEKLGEKYNKISVENKRLHDHNFILEKMVNGADEIAREKFMPLLHFPRFEKTAKEEILNWIYDYYSEGLIVHDRARDSFLKDNRNLDWRYFCMMIHYLYGYTKYRNENGTVINDTAARDYDPEGYGLKAQPTGSGPNSSTTLFKDAYTINIHKYDNDKNDVILDMHLAKCKGRGEDMIRIYFYYDSDIKKSIIGYMPDHLPTRTDPH